MAKLTVPMGLTFALVTSPLLFGSVYPWAWALLVWVVGTTFLVQQWPAEPQPGLRRNWIYLLPLAVFMLVVAAQLTPVPAKWMEFLSPTRYGYWILPYQVTERPLPDYFVSTLLPWGTVTEGCKFLAYFMAVAVVVSLLHAEGDNDYRKLVRLLFIAICFTGCAVALVGLIQVSVKAQAIYGFWHPYHSKVFMGPYVNRNHFAGYLEMAAPIGVSLLGLFLGQGRRGDGSIPDPASANAVGVILASGALMLTILGVFVSLSRSGILIMALVLALQVPVVLALLVRKGITLKAVVVIGLVIGCIAVFMSIMGWDKINARLRTLQQTEVSDEMRYDLFQNTWTMAMDFPVIGSGLGSYLRVFPIYKTYHKQSIVEHAHNDYLEFLAETGWVGLLAFLAFLVTVMVKGLLAIKRCLGRSADPDPERVDLGIMISGSLAGVLAISIHGLVDFNLRIPANALLFFVLCGMTLALCGIADQEARMPAGGGGRPRPRQRAGIRHRTRG